MRSNDSTMDACEEVGVILSSVPADGGNRMHAVRIGLYGKTIEVSAFETPQIMSAIEAPLTVWRFQLAQLPNPNVPPLLLAVDPEYFAEGLPYIPDDYCPVDGVVHAIRGLVNGIKTNPLRAFVVSVLQRRDVFDCFWAMQASSRDHHSFQGGLALHSMEAAADLASQGTLTDLERDLGTAGALLHDIGKIWSYTEDMFPNAAGLGMGHELVGLCRLEPQLLKLEQAWPDGAYVMRSLLSGHAWKRGNGSLPSALLPRIKACDQRSCERNLAARGGRRFHRPVWTPEPWNGPISLVFDSDF